MYPTVVFAEKTFPPAWFASEVSRILAGMHALGVTQGDTVAFMLKNSPEYVALVIACRQAGVYLVPINWHFKADEVNYLLHDSGASMLFVMDRLLLQIAAGLFDGLKLVIHGNASHAVLKDVIPPGVVFHPYADFGKGEVPAPATHTISQCMVPYTSGTTGKPKGVRRIPYPSEERQSRERDQQAVSRIFFGVESTSVALMSAPIYHSAPMAFVMHCCTVGAVLVLEAAFDAERTLQLIEHYKITHAYLVPTMFQRLLRLSPEVKARYDVSSICQVTSTGSPCAADVKLGMITWWGPVITESYASSEAGSITFIDSQTWLSHPGSVGRPIGTAKIRILDDAFQALPAGQIGAIYARQCSQPDFTYINNDAARRDIEHDGLFTLGDMGYLDDEGYLYICDRKADMVISGGANIYPAEIEAALQTMPGVADCAVFGIPDDEFGESLAAAIQQQPGASLQREQVQTYLRKRIANFKVPQTITFHNSLPREETGKIFKRLLREPYWRDKLRSI